MRAAEVKKLLKAEPFAPIRLGLSDGRSVLIHHPDQAVVAERHALVGLAKLETSPPLATPRSGRAIAKDWLIINLLHVATIEPVGHDGRKASTHRRR